MSQTSPTPRPAASSVEGEAGTRTGPEIGDGSPRAHRTPWAALGLDAALVVLFAGLGRLSHDEGVTFGGLAVSAAPFLAGTFAGWAMLLWRGWARPASVRGGTVVWLSTVVIGMLVRVVAGTGTAFTFVLVALAVNALFLLGWRALGRLLVGRAVAF
ncbi:MAG: DUF3054 domain-containing protein [Dermatophilaceae bacterium]